MAAIITRARIADQNDEVENVLRTCRLIACNLLKTVNQTASWKPTTVLQTANSGVRENAALSGGVADPARVKTIPAPKPARSGAIVPNPLGREVPWNFGDTTSTRHAPSGRMDARSRQHNPRCRVRVLR
jgi:hypothetical protein